MDMHPLRTYRLSKTPRQSQADLAQQLGVSRLTVLRWESGIRKIDERKVFDIAKIIGVPAKELRPDLLERYELLMGGSQ